MKASYTGVGTDGAGQRVAAVRVGGRRDGQQRRKQGVQREPGAAVSSARLHAAGQLSGDRDPV